MIRAYAHDDGRLRPLASPVDLGQAIWIDLVDPDAAEIDRVAGRFGLDLPTRDDMAEIETSSRLYSEGDAAFMTATLPAGADGDDPEMGPVTFVLTPERLITLRHHEPKPFLTYPARAQQAPIGCGTAKGVLLGLLDDIVDRLADVLERIGRDIEALSRSVFRREAGRQAKSRNFQVTLETIGRTADVLSKLRESLVSLDRVLAFLSQSNQGQGADREEKALLKTLSRDELSLTQHADFLSAKVTLLLDATLGLIAIEQNNIIKFFSVVAVVFLPPTLVASTYGMNFGVMPELDWRFGYPFAIGLMVISAILPYLFFKRRGWL